MTPKAKNLPPSENNFATISRNTAPPKIETTHKNAETAWIDTEYASDASACARIREVRGQGLCKAIKDEGEGKYANEINKNNREMTTDSGKTPENKRREVP